MPTTGWPETGLVAVSRLAGLHLACTAGQWPVAIGPFGWLAAAWPGPVRWTVWLAWISILPALAMACGETAFGLSACVCGLSTALNNVL